MSDKEEKDKEKKEKEKMEEKPNEQATELSDDDLDNVAGGKKIKMGE